MRLFIYNGEIDTIIDVDIVPRIGEYVSCGYIEGVVLNVRHNLMDNTVTIVVNKG